MKKLILVALTSVVFFALAGWLIVATRKPAPLPARVTLPDGTSVSILAVTYGTNHVVGTKMARIVARWPAGIRGVLQKIMGQRVVPVQTTTTSTPELLVWLDHRTNSLGSGVPTGGYRTAMLGDGSNFISGSDSPGILNGSLPNSMVYPLYFGAFPRRDREITLNIFYHDAKGVGHLCGTLSFANPLYQKYPQWQAEPLPATKRVGDLEVTLLGFETGHDQNQGVGYDKNSKRKVTYGTNRLNGQNQTVVDLKFRPLMNTNEVWQMVGVELSDATGNALHSSGMSWSGAGGADFACAFSPGLWPGESGWKAKLELKRTAGFRPGEMFVFKNVPLGELNRTNLIAWTTNVGGVTVTLQSIERRAPHSNDSWNSSELSHVRFTLSPLPAGTQMDLLRMVCDGAKTNNSAGSGSSGNNRDYFLDIPENAQTADFTLAVHQSRTVEFLVKPELPGVEAKAGQ